MMRETRTMIATGNGLTPALIWSHDSKDHPRGIDTVPSIPAGHTVVGRTVVPHVDRRGRLTNRFLQIVFIGPLASKSYWREEDQRQWWKRWFG